MLAGSTVVDSRPVTRERIFSRLTLPRESRPTAIADYAFLSDSNGSALVSKEGSIDWYCVPRFDSPAVFCRLLGADAGHWSLGPAGPSRQVRSYVGDSLVLRTEHETQEGKAAVTEGMVFAPGSRVHDIGHNVPHVLARRIEGLQGMVRFVMELAPRFEYGLTHPYLKATDAGVIARAGPAALHLGASVPLECRDGSAFADFTVGAGESVSFSLTYAPSFGKSDPSVMDAEEALKDTIEGWESWMGSHAGYQGVRVEQVRRSALVLQGLTYQPTGPIVAAATTSLPEKIGASDNFDYRFAWLRDASLMLRAQWVATCPDEPSRFFQWIARSLGDFGRERVQIMYGVAGERDLTEHELDHLEGFRDSRPVRVGNAAWKQKQLDVLGEILDGALLLKDQLGDFDEEIRRLLIALADRAAESWPGPDAGMWEARDEERDYVASKVMCWVALDRAVKLAPDLDDDAKADRWRAARDDVRETILKRGWNDQLGTFVGAFGSEDLDAAVLLMPLVDFLPATDERMRSTVEVIERELADGGLVRRWSSDESGFVICSYWLVECLALAGDLDKAFELFDRATSYANDIGLFSEEVDVHSGELLGNFPQAFSHIGLINAAWRLTELTQSETSRIDNDRKES